MIDGNSPEKVLVVLLGASEWTKSPNLGKSEAFLKSAKKLKNYLLSKFGLPENNLLDLFDSELGSDDIDEAINNWLEKKISAPKESEQNFTDLIVIYIGHGDFINGKDGFILAIRRTRESNYAASSIHISSLAKTIKEKARYLRRYIILDCCFAASAFKHFQQSSDITKAATVQSLEAFVASGKGYGIPQKGTALLCSSRHNKPSRLSPNNESTMFTEALVNALENGNSQHQEYISLEAICNLAQEYLNDTYQDEAPKPEIHSPDQSEGDVAAYPLFPNFARIKADHTTDKKNLANKPLKGINIPRSINPFDETNLRKAIEEDKNNAQLHADLGEGLIQQGRWRDAVDVLKKAVKLNGNIAIWHYKLGIALGEANENTHYAEEEFEKAVSLEPSNTKFRVDYAHILSSQRKWTDAIKHLTFILQKEPDNEEANTQLGLARQQHKLADDNYQEGIENERSENISVAINYFQTANKIEFNFKDTTNRIAALLIKNDRTNKFKRVNDSLEKQSKNAESYIALGDLYMDEENFKDAEISYEAALKMQPDNSTAFSRIGKSHFCQENWVKAESAFRKALTLDPKNAERYVELGAVAYAQMDWKEAIKHYKIAVELAPDNPFFRNNLAKAHRKRYLQLIKPFEPYTAFIKSKRKFIIIIFLSILLFVLFNIYTKYF